MRIQNDGVLIFLILRHDKTDKTDSFLTTVSTHNSDIIVRSENVSIWVNVTI